MGEITVAADEVAATELLHDAEVTIGQKSLSGSSSLGPFVANWNATAYLFGGTVDLTPPDLIGIQDCKVNYNIHFDFIFDLNLVLQPIVITFPPINFDFDFDWHWIHIHIHIHYQPPPIYIYWPHVTIPVGFPGVGEFDGNFKLNVYLSGGYWKIDAVSLSMLNIQLGNGASLLLAAIGLAAAAALSTVPFIGPVLAFAVAALTIIIALGGASNFLTNILNQFLAGLVIPLYNQPRVFTMLPAMSSIDPVVRIRLDELRAYVNRTDEDELIIDTSITPM
ncbi:MAG TPA: hypothetical protein VIW80_05795 [Pyrinomonadaceae bacterium]|jgi:hypothetical protein